MTLNILPSLPGRSCVKNAPAPLLAKCNQIVIINNMGHIINSAINTIVKSIMRLKKFLYIDAFFRSTDNGQRTTVFGVDFFI